MSVKVNVSEVRVAGIEIEFPDGEVQQISIEGARELFRQLGELFGDKTPVVRRTPVIEDRPRWNPMRPDFQWSDETWPREPMPYEVPKVWCGPGSPVSSAVPSVAQPSVDSAQAGGSWHS